MVPVMTAPQAVLCVSILVLINAPNVQDLTTKKLESASALKTAQTVSTKSPQTILVFIVTKPAFCVIAVPLTVKVARRWPESTISSKDRLVLPTVLLEIMETPTITLARHAQQGVRLASTLAWEIATPAIKPFTRTFIPTLVLITAAPMANTLMGRFRTSVFDAVPNALFAELQLITAQPVLKIISWRMLQTDVS